MGAAKKTKARNGLIAKIHVAKKQLAINEDSYRDVLLRVTGKESCSAMQEPELEAVIKEFRRLGFSAKKKPKRAGARKMADTMQAAKIRALWLDLYHLGEIEDPSEEALAKFSKRMSGREALQWLTPAEADKVIKALRGWLARIGFIFPEADMIAQLFQWRIFYGGSALDEYAGLANKLSLISQQCKILGIDGKSWLSDEGFGECGTIKQFMGKCEPEQADQIIEQLGKMVRKAKA